MVAQREAQEIAVRAPGKVVQCDHARALPSPSPSESGPRSEDKGPRRLRVLCRPVPVQAHRRAGDALEVCGGKRREGAVGEVRHWEAGGGELVQRVEPHGALACDRV